MQGVKATLMFCILYAAPVAAAAGASSASASAGAAGLSLLLLHAADGIGNPILLLL